jgi:hypothetical protein
VVVVRRLQMGLLKCRFLRLGEKGKSVFPTFAEQRWQLGDVRRDAPRLIESQRLGDSGIARIGVAVDIGESLSAGVHYLEAAV